MELAYIFYHRQRDVFAIVQKWQEDTEPLLAQKMVEHLSLAANSDNPADVILAKRGYRKLEPNLPISRLSRHFVSYGQSPYLGRRSLRADSQHNAARFEQARVESGYDEEVHFVESNTVKKILHERREKSSSQSLMNPSNLPAVAPPLQVPSEASKRLLPWLVAFAFFMESLDTTILNTAVPAISAALHVKPLSMKAVLASYTLSLAVFIPISGWVADRFGTRRVFAAAIGLFTLGSFLCGISSNIDALVACRILQGMGGSMMVPVGRMTLVRTFSKSGLLRAMSFVSIPALVAPMLGPIAGGLIVAYLHWRFIFFVNIPIGLAGLVLVYLYLPDYREEKTHPLDIVGLILFGSGIALLSYVLEVFGEHTLGVREITGLLVVSLTLLAGYWVHAKTLQFPLLQLSLFRIRTFRAAVGGGLFTRLGIGGVPFLLPLLYQVGLGFTPIQSGLLLMPQALAAISVNWVILRLLARFGYRGVLVTNTIIIGMLLLLFATIGVHTPIWVIVALAFLYGAYSSLQYTSMNTLVYADTTEEETSAANSIFSTVQQMAISFGVATAGLATAFFIPEHSQSNPALMIDGLHKALLSLGVLTILSTTVFGSLKNEDGRAVSQQKAIHPGG